MDNVVDGCLLKPVTDRSIVNFFLSQLELSLKSELSKNQTLDCIFEWLLVVTDSRRMSYKLTRLPQHSDMDNINARNVLN